DLENALRIRSQNRRAHVRRDLHRLDGTQRAAGKVLPVTAAERRIGTEQHALGSEEIERELEHFRHEILARGVAIELLEMIDVGPPHLVGNLPALLLAPRPAAPHAALVIWDEAAVVMRDDADRRM